MHEQIEPIPDDPASGEQPKLGMAKFALLFGIFVAGVGNSFVFAVLPPVGRAMGFTEIYIGLIITLSAFVFMFGARFWGARSEVRGRKPVILIALRFYTVTALLFAAVVHLRLAGVLPMVLAYVVLIIFRVLFSGGISGIFPASQAYMADITSHKDRIAGMSLIGIAMGLGMTAGPGMATFSTFGIVVPFYLVALLAIPAYFMASRYIVEQPREVHPDAHKNGGPPLREMLPLFFISTSVMVCLSSIQQASGFYFQDKFDLTTEETAHAVGIALMAMSIASVVAQLLLVFRFSLHPRILLRTGVPCAFVGAVLLITVDQYPALVAALAVFGMGTGQIIPSTIASVSMKAGLHQQGRLAGVNVSAQGMGFIIGPMLSATLYTIDPLLPYKVCLGILAVLMVNVYFVVKIPH